MAECWVAAPKRVRNAAKASEWVRFNPLFPAIRNLRPSEGMASKRWTSTPAANNASAAISPAGPPPTIAALFVEIAKDHSNGAGAPPALRYHNHNTKSKTKESQGETYIHSLYDSQKKRNRQPHRTR